MGNLISFIINYTDKGNTKICNSEKIYPIGVKDIEKSMSPTLSSLASSGLNGPVNISIEFFDKLYIGGNFTGTNDNKVSSIGIICYDPQTTTWIPVANGGLTNGDGSPGIVNNIIIYNGSLVIVGNFSQTADNSIKITQNVVIYKPFENNGTWKQFICGLNNTVNCVSQYEINSIPYFVFGGNFTANNDSSPIKSNNIIIYRIDNNTWIPLSNSGLATYDNNGYIDTSIVNYITVLSRSGQLVLAVSGVFNQTFDKQVTNLNLFAYYNLVDNIWTPLTSL